MKIEEYWKRRNRRWRSKVGIIKDRLMSWRIRERWWRSRSSRKL